MDPLSITAGVIAILDLSAKVLAYLNDVKDAPKACEDCNIEVGNLHGLLVSLRYRLREAERNRQTHQPWFENAQNLGKKDGPLDQYFKALELIKSKMEAKNQIKNALVWTFKKKEVEGITVRIERLKTLIEIAIQMDHFKLSEAIREDTEAIQNDVTTVKADTSTIRSEVTAIKDNTNHLEAKMTTVDSSVSYLEHAQLTADEDILLKWISPSDYPAQQSDIIRKRQDGTGQWVLDAPEFQQWRNESKSTLFCPGIPGAGKTMAAAIAINQLLELKKNSLSGVAYVYCNYQSQTDQNTTSILAAFLKQLAFDRPTALTYIQSLRQKHRGGTRPSSGEIYHVLEEVLRQYPHVYIIVDALDECQGETRRQLLQKLFQLQKSAYIRFMATSRHIPDIQAAFRESIKLEILTSREDVKRFVTGQIYRLPACIQRDAELQKNVQEGIVEAVDGMFLLARLHTDSLLDKRTVKQVRSALSSLTKGAAALDIAYGDALKRIESQLSDDQKLAKCVLTWITYAKRPLTTAEICCALAIEPGEKEFDPDNKPLIDDIISVCAGLVVVDQESDIVRLVHYTTYEYFERIGSELSSKNQTELLIVEACLSYLSMDVFESGGCATIIEFSDRLQQNEFLYYAATYCGDHVREIEDVVADLAYAFVTRHPLLACAEQARRMLLRASNVSALHWAAEYGLRKVAEQLLRTTEDAIAIVNMLDWRDYSPLTYASESGDREMVILLLENGAQVNFYTEYCDSPLVKASSKGDERMVTLLLERGADIHVQEDLALHSAISKGHEKLVELLLDKGADIHAVQVYGLENRSPLQMASFKGHENIVRILLDRGIDYNPAQICNALPPASARGSTYIVQLLLDRCTEFQAPQDQPDEVMIRVQNLAFPQNPANLMYWGLNMGTGLSDKTVHSLETALYVASCARHWDIVELLLRSNVYEDKILRRTLHKALADSYERVFQLFLDIDVNINVRIKRLKITLLEAVSGDHEELLNSLLDKGRSMIAQADKQLIREALGIASCRGHEQIVKVLLEEFLGVITHESGSILCHALECASQNGHVEIAALLLEKGAAIVSHVEAYPQSEAIKLASFYGHKEIVELILDWCPGIDATSLNLALWNASVMGWGGIAALLRENGAKELTSEEVECYENA
ncbi:unnamed protein product [Periconia digitata]|uniref:Uncharacterized protein n=1 Tax=Periconia digitata TaxID=1303443 RepID=A0A9W4UUP9_9PLEO|nr:unnamed protein product [Periconia digitata]